MDEDIHDIFIRKRLLVAILRARELREHAGNGNRRRGATARCAGEIDHIALLELRIGFPPVAIQRKIRRAGSFARNDDGNAWLMHVTQCGQDFGVLADWADLNIDFLAGLREIMHRRHDR